MRYFDLWIIENKEFLGHFINDLTFVPGKVDLKLLFNDIYYSNKSKLTITDYILELH